MYNPHRNEWSTGPQLPPNSFSFTSCAVLGRGICLLVGGATHNTGLARFDRHHNRWSDVGRLSTPRVHLASAALRDHLFVMVRPSVLFVRP